MPIIECEHCKTLFTVPRKRVGKARFCSVACSTAGQTRVERRILICRGCGNSFSTKADHGVWPKFCSRECWSVGKEHKQTFVCEGCAKEFEAIPKADVGTRRFCSISCRDDWHQKRKVDQARECPNCRTKFYVRPSSNDVCCSAACTAEWFVGERAANWKGGHYIAHGRNMLRVKRPDRIGPYMGEHRVVASKAIGRLLHRHECVLHISGEFDDNNPDNLFICASIREMRQRFNGALPWPEHSNLDSYVGENT